MASESSQSGTLPTAPTSNTSSDDGLLRRWSTRFSSYAGLDTTEHEGQTRTCEKWKRHLMTCSPAVVFMLKHLKFTGCPVLPGHFVCAPCGAGHSGGFSPDDGSVVLCQGKFANKRHMEETIVHELVHLYDHCKFQVDWGNLRHHACSEIRANVLSGDCRFFREVNRGHFSFSKQFQTCVRRRAAVSLGANPACPDRATAERVVDEVWESCFNDTRPFDEIY